MELSQRILSEISEVIRDIKKNYPELQKYLDERPMTLPDGNSTDYEMDNKVLEEYLNGLKEMVRRYQNKQ